MGLTQTHSSIDEERVVGFRGLLGNGQSRRVSELVTKTYYKVPKGVFRVEITGQCVLAGLLNS
jgi:hypothetical protein